MIKKVLTGALSAVLALSLAGCSSSSSSAKSSSASGNGNDHLARIKEAGKLTIGLEGDWQPFSYHDKDDKLVGYDVEVSKNIAKKLGVKANIVEGPWDGLLTGLSTGTYDVVVNGVDITDDRKKTFDFSDPYAYDHTVLVTRTDNTDIHSFEDLKGKTTANSVGSTYEAVGEKYGATVQGVDDLTKCMELVENKSVDAMVNAETSVRDYLKTTGKTDLEIRAKMKEATPYAIPLKKGKDNDSLRKAINKALKEMRDDGTLKKLSEKYFGADLTNE